ncbi:metallopeptidase, catalytic domain protein [Plakobranchus ocellatus]|uniref:Metallopeptidase, catalytic domain protein n=1 Tax=Plakobranchus ocellatus TaxID=259542 RepID=A0AAV3ZDB8_9GAST|nr:metallopeptidase, catalytic domain protein [Plakobranchus ocellatus]
MRAHIKSATCRSVGAILRVLQPGLTSLALSDKGDKINTQGGSIKDTQGGSFKDTQGGSIKDTQGGSIKDTQGGSINDTEFCGGSIKDTQGGSIKDTQGGSIKDTQGGRDRDKGGLEEENATVACRVLALGLPSSHATNAIL